MTMDKGREFAREVSETLQNEYGIKRKIITSRNPQSNSMIERCHKTLHNMIRSAQIKDKRATPTQLVFGRDAMLNATFQADWQFIRERKQRLIIQNNAKHENAKRKPHAYNVGDVVVVKAGKGRKHGSNPYLDPMRITQVYDKGTVKLVKVADNNGGAVSQPGRSGILNRAWPDHPSVIIRGIARLRPRDSKALERLQVLSSKPSTHISRFTY